MSNSVVIEPTRFVSARSGEVTFGYRAYDDYAGTYCNNLPSIPDDDLEFLRAVVDNGIDETLAGLISYCRETEKGLCIGDTFYDWDSVKDILNR